MTAYLNDASINLSYNKYTGSLFGGETGFFTTGGSGSFGDYVFRGNDSTVKTSTLGTTANPVPNAVTQPTNVGIASLTSASDPTTGASNQVAAKSSHVKVSTLRADLRFHQSAPSRHTRSRPQIRSLRQHVKPARGVRKDHIRGSLLRIAQNN